jgi:hypothetical protein
MIPTLLAFRVSSDFLQHMIWPNGLGNPLGVSSDKYFMTVNLQFSFQIFLLDLNLFFHKCVQPASNEHDLIICSRDFHLYCFTLWTKLLTVMLISFNLVTTFLTLSFIRNVLHCGLNCSLFC